MLYVIGCGRSGTKYTTAILQELGLDVCHEKSGSDGEVGWRGLLKLLEGQVDPTVHVILHQVRNPLETISSLRTHNSELLKIVSTHFSTFSSMETDDGKLHRCMEYWYEWNLLAEKYASWRFLVETLPDTFERFCQEVKIKRSKIQLSQFDTSLNTRRTKRFADFQREPITWKKLSRIDEGLCQKIKELAIRYGYGEEYFSNEREVQIYAKEIITESQATTENPAESSRASTRKIYIDKTLLGMPQVRSITDDICDGKTFFASSGAGISEESWTLSWGYPVTKRRFGVGETGFFWDAMHIDTQGLYQFSSLNSAEGIRQIQEFSPPESAINLVDQAPLPKSKYRQPSETTDWTGVVFACQNPADRSIHSVASTEDWWLFYQESCRYYGKNLFVKLHPWNSNEIEARIREIADRFGCQVGKAGHSLIENCEHVVLFNSTFSVDCMIRGIPVKQGAPGYFSQTGAVSYCAGNPRSPLKETQTQATQLVEFLAWRFCFSMDCTLDEWRERLCTFAHSRDLFPVEESQSYAAYLKLKSNPDTNNGDESSVGGKIVVRECKPDQTELSPTIDRPLISFCTTCMGRLSYLCQTLPENITANKHFYPKIEFLLLDYNSQDGLHEWVTTAMSEHVDSGLLTVYHVTQPDLYHSSHAKNVAHRVSRGEIVCNLDADNYLVPGYVELIWDEIAKDQNVILFGRGRDSTGKIAMLRKHFLEIGGYNEEMRGYGYDDVDLIKRSAKHLSLKQKQVKEFNRSIGHSHEVRVRHMEFESIHESNVLNRKLMDARLESGQLVTNQKKQWGAALVQKNYVGPLINSHDLPQVERSSVNKKINADPQYLDGVKLDSVSLGYGELGLRGNLGYEAKKVVVDGIQYPHSISAHGPSLLTFTLDGNYRWFQSRVAFNDDVPDPNVVADFLVFADGRLVGIAKNVVPGDPERRIVCEIEGVTELKLQVLAKGREGCHSVWLNPTLHRTDELRERFSVDCLSRVTVTQSEQLEVELCVATVGSPGFENWVETLLASFVANAQLPEAKFVIFFVGGITDSIQTIANRHDALIICCQEKKKVNPNVKSVLYSVGRYVAASRYLCLDADMLVMEDLRPLAASIDASPVGSVLVTREGKYAKNLKQAIEKIYKSEASQFPDLLNGNCNDEENYDLVVNDGFFAGTRASLCAVDELIRSFKYGHQWVDEKRNVGWRNQFIFNLALAKSNCGQEVSRRFNWQLQNSEVHRCLQDGLVHASLPEGGNASILHFNGSGRRKYPEWRKTFEGIQTPEPVQHRPLFTYSDFKNILRRWVGYRGLPILAWSFYGTSNGKNAVVKDYPEYGLYETLYALIRNNGCSRVLETGTARGISTSCIAFAISKFENPVLVSFDTKVFPERDEIWGMLPDVVSQSIEAKQMDCIQGMKESIQRGESYHAALLDSDHSGEHVYKEFKLASQLVCKGGIILIHDPILESETVEMALAKIRSEGYGVTRLLCASEGESMDDGLGLAVIENNQFPDNND